MALRIGFDLTPLSVARSGVGTYTACLLEQLQQGPDTILPLSHNPANQQWSAYHRRPAGNSAGRPKVLNKTLWMQLHLPREIKQLQPDLCHFTNHVAPLWLPCPSILTIHDMTLWLYPAYHPLRRLVSMRPIIPHAARRAAAIITVSHSAKADIVRILGVPSEKVHVIYEAPGQEFRPLGDNGERNSQTVTELEAVRRVYNLPERFILHVGTLEPRKNLVRLLKAFAHLRRTRAVPHDLVLVGQRGWKWEQIFATVEKLDLAGAIHFLDYVPGRRLPSIYNLADALVYPSLYEGFGLPVIEAMASGLPVVTAPSGALPEVAGEAAQMVDPTDVESIAEGIYQVLTDRLLHATLRARGLAWATRFSWSKTAEQTRQLYCQVANGEQPALESSVVTRAAGPYHRQTEAC
jgi:glycosyltransferase involved in cell wall biosynthesis